MIRFIKIMAIGLSVLFMALITLGLFGAFDGQHGSVQAQRQEACTRFWQDAAPGPEKRLAREMCDKLGVEP